MSGRAPANMAVFRDITVMPTQGLKHGFDGRVKRQPCGLYRGGPVWPRFALQVRARHCRGLLSWPVDRRPFPAAPVDHLPTGVWCGPVSPHFGHMIADFAMRLPAAASADTDWPLVFSVGPADPVEAPEPPPFFWQLLAWFGIARDRVVLVRAPLRIARLAVPEQAERLGGRGPSRRHLDRMDALVARNGPPTPPIGCLFVTRAGLKDGRLAAEPYLVDALVRAGVIVLHPERCDLATQLDLYRRACRIVFSEGSALHALQLIGRLDADVAVLVRRPGHRMAWRALGSRVAGLRYWDRARGLLYGLSVRGRPLWERALVLIDPRDLWRWFAELEVDLAGAWDAAAYREALDADVRTWVTYNRVLNLHPNVRPTIAQRLRSLLPEFDLDSVWPSNVEGTQL